MGLLFLLMMSCGFCFSQEYNSDTTLLIVGSFSLKNNLNRNIHVKLYSGDIPLDSMVVAGNQEFGFYLQRNSNYTIVITREGFVRKTIAVSTELPENIRPKHWFTFGFTVPLVKEQVENNEDKYVKYVSQLPIAYVYYNDVIKKFDSDRDYVKNKKEALFKARQAAKAKQ
jgi:hypothetical protein